ncbi:thiamine biosynthesis protein ThiS [Abyssogena phaseoliformis symbiont OG214]|uniref:sulfur carrier protein ThiS n=1 Tax=Abyssogena phaseoliformis symbiont TaxID=596095 RepID=UPI001916443F|nr:sulfur carrier protein ThiS [Abyssogena phaseoliformis symbiont]MBW5289731.1 Sulfur carrier protein ThiS [Candidatus Ruthia sp. Apha_13_S6]BBB23019.1 thiamine biosynthesis protein ThiS [Abyssogena phaseoliformis symbiont OG214]
MTLTLNGESLEMANGLNAHDLIVQLGYKNQRIALEVNEVIIPKSKHAEFTLNEGDICEIIKAVGGG